METLRYEYFQRVTNPFQTTAPEAQTYVKVFEDELHPVALPPVHETLAYLFMAHNRDDRPRRREIRSMSVGDIIRLFDKSCWLVDITGFRPVVDIPLPEN